MEVEKNKKKNTVIKSEKDVKVTLLFQEDDNLEVEDKIVNSLLASYENRIKK